MPKVILKSNYIKGGGAHGANLIGYIGTRDGVEKHVQKYVDYIANRKGVEKVSEHGLFTSGNDKIVLSKVQTEVANHKGNIWLPIISLTREDAIKTGFDNSAAWKNMLSQLAPKIADCYKIKLDNLQWYASYHDEGHHPHVHMVMYSKDPNEGFLTKKGIEKFKAMVMKEVFSLELEQVYALQSMQRDEVKQRCKEMFRDITLEPNNEMMQMIFELSNALQNHKGKKTYGYLKKADKEKVDNIVNALEKLPQIKEAYDLWYATKCQIHNGYTDDMPKRLPLSEQKEFRSIKNMILNAVDEMELNQEQSIDIPIVATGILKVLASMEKLFTHEIIKDGTTINERIDRKAFQKLMKKKQAQGRVQSHVPEHGYTMSM